MNGLVADTEKPTKSFKVDVDVEIADAVNAIFDRQGMTSREGGKRLLLWFSQLDDDMQAVILGQVRGKGAIELATKFLERTKALHGPDPRMRMVGRASGPTRTDPPKPPR